MTHQPVEIERRTCARISLHRDKLRQIFELCRSFRKHTVGLFQRGATRQIKHHLDFGFIVEGQQFHAHALRRKKSASRERGNTHNRQEPFRRFAALQQRRGDTAIKTAHRTAILGVTLAIVTGRIFTNHFHQEPRRDGDCDKERKQHRHRGVGRDGTHIGAHHAAHKHHRQKGCDNRQRCDNRRVAHFCHCIDSPFDPATIIAHGPMAHDIFNHDNRVIDQNTDGENQREKTDAIDRITHQPRGKEREQNGGWNNHQHHHAFTPANRQRDEDNNRDGSKRQMEQELIGFFGCRLAVIAGDFNLYTCGNNTALHGLQTFDDIFCNNNRIRTFAFGQRKAN